MLRTIHPLAKLVACLGWLAASILVFDPLFQLAIVAIAVLALIAFDRVSPLVILALAAPFALFGFGFLTTAVLFRQDGYAVRMSSEAILASPAFAAGLTLFGRAIACGMISALFALTTDPGLLTKALMREWRLPPRIGYALFSMLQLASDLASEAQHMRLARAMTKGRPPRRLPGPGEIASLVIPLLAFAIRQAGEAAIALEARGLEANKPRTIFRAPRFARRDGIFLVVATALLAFLIAAARAG